jgi:hypothetical protein
MSAEVEMEPKTSLKEVQQRLSKLEKSNSTSSLSGSEPIDGPPQVLSTVDTLQARKKTIQHQQLEEIKKPFFESVKKLELKGNWAKLKTAAVQFVEEIAPKVAQIVGFAIAGQFKLDLCMDLLKSVVGILPSTIVDEVEEVVHLVFNKNKNADGTTTIEAKVEKSIEVKGDVKKKKRIFH